MSDRPQVPSFWARAAILGIALAAVGSPGFPSPGQSAASIRDAADTPEFHLARGLDDLKNSRYLQAEQEFRAALALDPRLIVRAQFPLAVTLFDLQERDEARRQFEAVRARTGDDPNLNYYLGRLDLMDGNLDSAIHNLTLAASDPPFSDTDYYLGYAYLKKKDFASAEKWLNKAADLAPRDARIHERLGLLYRAIGRPEKAEKAFAKAAELHRQDVAATEQALACGRSLDTQLLERAREVCRKLLDPEDLGKLVSLGALYAEHGDYLEALEPFRLAVNLDPDSYEMQYNLGLTYFRLKRYAEARAPLEKAAAERPDMFETVAPLGAVLYALGDDADAFRVLDRANRLNPANPDASRLLVNAALNLAAQCRARHDLAGARRYLLRAVQARPDDPAPHRQLAALDEFRGNHSAAARERQQAERLSAH